MTDRPLIAAFWRGFWDGVNPMWSLAWGLYWLGHLASMVMVARDGSERWCAFWYPVYNRLMLASSGVQDYFGLRGPWQLASLENRE